MAKKKKDAEDAGADSADKEEPKEGAEGDTPAEGEAAAGGGKKKLIIFIAAPILLLAIAGAGLYFTGMLDGLLGKKAPVEGKAGEHGEGAAGGEGGGHGEGAAGPASNFLAIPPMLVNLNSEDGSSRYLRLSVQLELKKSGDKSAVEAVIPRVIDQFQTYLRELKVQDLQGSAGIYRLQMELLWRVNQAAAPVEIKDVLFQEILIQ